MLPGLQPSIIFQTQNFISALKKLGYEPNDTTIFTSLKEMASKDQKIAERFLGDFRMFQGGEGNIQENIQAHREDLAEDIRRLQNGERLQHRTVLKFFTDTQDFDDNTKELVEGFVKGIKSLKPQEQEKSETAINKPEKNETSLKKVISAITRHEPVAKDTYTDEERKALDDRIYRIVFGDKRAEK